MDLANADKSLRRQIRALKRSEKKTVTFDDIEPIVNTID